MLVESLLDAVVPELLVAVNAASVDAPEDFDAMACAAGHFGGRYSGVKCEGDAAMAQVVRAGGER